MAIIRPAFKVPARRRRSKLRHTITLRTATSRKTSTTSTAGTILRSTITTAAPEHTSGAARCPQDGSAGARHPSHHRPAIGPPAPTAEAPKATIREHQRAGERITRSGRSTYPRYGSVRVGGRDGPLVGGTSPGDVRAAVSVLLRTEPETAEVPSRYQPLTEYLGTIPPETARTTLPYLPA